MSSSIAVFQGCVLAIALPILSVTVPSDALALPPAGAAAPLPAEPQAHRDSAMMIARMSAIVLFIFILLFLFFSFIFIYEFTVHELTLYFSSTALFTSTPMPGAAGTVT